MFAFASVIFHVLIYGGNVADASLTVKEAIPQILSGCVRNQFLASSLWFLSCLFLVAVFFQFIKRLRHPMIIFAVSLAVFLFKAYAPFEIPTYYNLHYAMHYQFYYIIGYLTFPKINSLLSSEKLLPKSIKWISGLWSAVFTALLFFSKNVYSVFSLPKIFSLFVPVITALTAIWFFLLVSYLLQNCTLFSDMGKSTLYFCGSEFIIKRVANTVVGAFFTINIHNSMIALVVSFILLLLSHRLLVPVEKAIFSSINKRLDSARKFILRKN